MVWILSVALVALALYARKLSLELRLARIERDEWIEKAKRYHSSLSGSDLGCMGVQTAQRQFTDSELQRMAQLQNDMLNACPHGVHVFSCPVCAPVRL